MSASPDRPALVPVNLDGIPPELANRPRWAPWRAVWNEKKKKYEKIPHRSDRPAAGLSNQTAKGWCTLERAMATYMAHRLPTGLKDREGEPVTFAGVGYLMTGQEDVTGIDLDHCITDGQLDPWAARIVEEIGSYTEISPSGNGLHLIVTGHLSEDWLNHEQGIEVYSGNIARFLTITGARLPGTVPDARPLKPALLDSYAARWRKRMSAAEVHDLHLPGLIPDVLLPQVEDMGLLTKTRNFLEAGPGPGDRSHQLFSAAIDLYNAGCSKEEILSIFEANEHAMEIALDHRRQDYDKALRYLWKDHCQAGAARAEELRREKLSEFDIEDLTAPAESDVEEAGPTATQVYDPINDFDDLGAEEQQQVATPATPAKAPRFTPISPAVFLQRKPASWIIKGLLPRAGMAVVYGASGSGKTFLTFDLAGAVATGSDWRGMPVQKGRCVYVVAEGAGGFRNRLDAYCSFHGIDPAAFDIGVIADAPNILDKVDVRDLLKALIAFGKIDLIVFDTYARVMAGGNENDAKDVGQAVAHCDVIHRKTGAMVVLVHHSGKDASKGARGSGALRAAADLEIEVVQTREYRAATVTKQKDGEDGKEYQFKLAEVKIGEDEDGYPITSCVIEHRENVARRPAAEKPLTPTQKLVLTTLDTAMDLGDSGVHFAELKHLVVEQMPKDPTKKKDNRHRDAGNAIESLVASGDIEQDSTGHLVRAENRNT